MQYLLMHKDIQVAMLDLTDAGDLNRVNVLNKEHTPIGAQMNNIKFKEWWYDRAVPKTRDGCLKALRELGIPTTHSMLLNTLGLSLNDCYWVKPVTSNFKWIDINLYINGFEDIFGEIEAFMQNKIHSIATMTMVEHKNDFKQLENPVDIKNQ